MGCSVKRNKNGDIIKVVAENGKDSILYQSYLDAGLHPENALRKWAVSYTPTFRSKFPDFTEDSNGEPLISEMPDDIGDIVAPQKNTFYQADELGKFARKWNINNQGFTMSNQVFEHMMKKDAEKLGYGVARARSGKFYMTKGGRFFNPWKSKFQENAEAIGESLTELNDAMHQYLRSIGVDVRAVETITDKDGNILDAVAKADMVNKVVDVVLGKAGVDTLPEEAAHFFVEILESSAHPLFNSLMRNVENYQVYEDVINSEFYQEQYEGNERSLKKEAIGKLIAKAMVAQMKNEPVELQQRAQGWLQKLLNYIRSLFAKTRSNPYSKAAYIMLNEKAQDYGNVNNIDTLDGMFFQETNENNTTNPVDTTLNKLEKTREHFTLESVNAEDNGIKEPWIVEEGSSTVDRYVGRPGSPYAGVVIKGRPSDAVKKYFYKAYGKRSKQFKTDEEVAKMDQMAEIRKQTGTEAHAVMQELVELYANRKGNIGDIQRRASGLFTKAQFEILAVNVKALVKQVNDVQKEIDPEAKATFLTEQLVHSPSRNIAGSLDFLVLFSDNSAAVYDWKFVSPTNQKYVQWKNGRYQVVEDMFENKMDTYNIQLGEYKQILINDYGVSMVRQSRIVPAYIRYKFVDGRMTRNLSTVQMALNKDGNPHSEYLSQIPVAEEMTDYESINNIIIKLISKKKQVEDKLKNKKFEAGETFESLVAKKKQYDRQLRKLQLDQDIAYVLDSIKKDLKDVDKRIAETNKIAVNGDSNPMWMSLDDLLDLNNDLIFYKELLATNDYVRELEKSNPEQYKKTMKLIQEVGATLSLTKAAVMEKIKERVNDNAVKRGVKGAVDYNPGLSYMTGNFVTLSKQSHPMMRNLWEIVDELNFARRKESKIVAAEIQALVDSIENLPGTPISNFKKLVNEETGNFVSKFDKKFYAELDEARKNGTSKWFRDNMYIDEDSYKRNFKKYRDGKLKALKRKHKDNIKAIEREILAWDKMHDVKNYYNTAAPSKGGKYFLRADEKWISQEYREIQSVPALKNFYEYYTEKIREVEDMYGERLGPGFIANIKKTLVESYVDKGGMKGIKGNILDEFQMREHDLSMGVRDENTGKLIRKVPKLYIRPLVDSNGNIDPSLKSYDLGKGLMLLYNAALDYKMKNDVLPEVLAMEALLKENQIMELDTDVVGNAVNTLAGTARKIFETQDNAKIFTGYVDQYFFGNTMDAKDFKIGSLSGLKTLLQAKQYHSMMALGIKVPVAAGAFMAGMFALESQASKGRFIKRKKLRNAQKALMSAEPKMRALAEFFDIYQREDSQNRARLLSGEYATRHMTNDKWFAFLSTADRGIDAVILHSIADNYGIDKDTGKLQLLDKLPEGTKSILEIMEIKENPAWEATAGNVSNKAVDRYIVNIPGLVEKEQRRLRNISRRMSDKVKGTMTDEDIALYNNTLLMRFMMHYKSWLPGIAMERFGKLRYDQILDTFDEGTWISAFTNFGLDEDVDPQKALDTEVHMLTYLSSLGQDLMNIGIDITTFGYTNYFKPKRNKARLAFNQWAANNASNPEFADRLKDPVEREKLFEEFIEMKQGNIRGFLMEARATLLLFMLMAILGGDWDDDGKIDIRQTWAGRKLYNVMNRTYREVAVFFQPQEFMESGRATGIPLLTLGGDLFKLSSNTIDETRDLLLGENSNRDRTNQFHYTFKMVPGLNAFARMIETSDQYKYSRV